ncbi:hypothetical protein [Agromyces sp. ZXT2-6]|uniref:hypothetical protein n=1 Tax=Agromyces sp. ZXT2-6 TaxID=3461153 RepID=UPI004054B686
MSGKALARLATVVIIIGTIFLLALLGAGWGALTSSSGWGAFGILLLPTLGCFGIGQALASAAKRKGVNPTTWESYPRGDAPAKVDPTRRHFIMSALRQTLVEDPAGTEIAGSNLAAADEMLRSYHQAPEANWGVIWQEAARSRKLPMYGEAPYWSNTGPGGRPVPLTYLAFWDSSDRLRAVRDGGTAPSIVGLAMDDPDLAVRSAARTR